MCFCYRQKDHQSPLKKTVSAAENIVEQFSDHTTQNLDATKSDMDTCEGLAVGHAVESASAPKGWVIGPLFQSFKSKMASFTEMVMTPVKLFRANSPPPSMDHPDKLVEGELQAIGTSDGEPSELSNMFHSEAQSENGNQDANQQRLSEVEGAQNAQTVAIKYSRKLAFDVELSTDECATTQKETNIPDSVPLQHSPLPCFVSEEVSESMPPVFRSSILLQPTVNVSASHESKLKISGAEEEPKGKLAARLKPLPRKCTGNRKKVPSKSLTSEVKNEECDPDVIDVQLSHMNSVKSNKVDSSNIDNDAAFPQSDGDDGSKMESCQLVHQSLRHYLNDNANGRILRPTLDTQQLECHLNPETYSAADLGRAKRELKLDCHSQDSVKRKRLTADVYSKNTKRQELLNVASDGGILRVLRPPRKEVVSTDTIVDREEMLRPVRKRPTRANKKGKDEQEMLTTINEAVHTQTESSFNAILVCSLDKSGASEDSQKGNNSKVKPSGSCKRLKTKAGLSKPDVNIDNGMNLETTIAITSTKQAEQEQLAEVFVSPDIKQLQSTRKCKDMNKKPQKRKSPNHASSTTESDSKVVSTPSALSVKPLEETPIDLNTSQHVQKEESKKKELNQPSKRPKKGSKSSASGGSHGTKQCIHDLHLKTKENQSQEGKGKISMDSVYFEMTPFESNHQPCPSPTNALLDCYVQLNTDIKHFIDGNGKDTASVADEAFPINTESSNHSNVSRLRSRGVNIKPRRDNRRRKCRGLHSRTRKGEEVTISISKDDADLAIAGTHSSKNGLSKRLLRSYSCPEIPSLHSSDMPWTSLHSPHHSRVHTSHQHHFSHSPVAHHAHKSLRRARRHTVCSVEVEREIAPLCLRKEVYPSRRSVPYDGASQNLSPSLALSPSTSLSALASYFLSSPLAFLSKKVDSRVVAASPSTSSHVSSPTSSSIYPLTPSTWHLPGFLQRTDSCSATLDSSSR